MSEGYTVWERVSLGRISTIEELEIHYKQYGSNYEDKGAFMQYMASYYEIPYKIAYEFLGIEIPTVCVIKSSEV